jgi:formylglycine-generating enzyme required for sulfatase activity
VPHDGYDFGSGADVLELTDSPIYSPSAINNFSSAVMHRTPNNGKYDPTREPNVSLAITPETQTVSGSSRKGYRLTFTFYAPGHDVAWLDPMQVWVQDLTLETLAGPRTNYSSLSNPRDNKPDWAYPQPGEYDGPYYCVRTISPPVRDASMDNYLKMDVPKLTKSQRTWSIWVPKGQGVYRDAQDNYGFYFSPPLPGVQVQSANESGLYFADMEFYTVNARITYWDNAWYESINIHGALPKESNALRFFINKKDIVSQSIKMANPHTPTRMLQVDRTEITYPDYFFVTSNRIPNSNTMLDPTKSKQPIAKVTWFDAIIYCNLRSELEGKEKVYSFSNPVYGYQGRPNCTGMSNLKADLRKNGYRLPTEEEWMHFYSALGGSEFYWPSNADPNAYAWFGTQTLYTRDVGLKLPNSKGLYDIAGNSAEYVWAGEYGNPESDSKALLKGGAVELPESSLGKSWRLARFKHDSWVAHSFRVVRTVPNPVIPILLFLNQN